ncbi:MAG: GTPase Era [Betaproteobacteria bacterium]|nr:GTPase Era [Betaproteobacteria bacterium]
MTAEFRCGTVAIVGRPNVGKSSLLNHVIGQKVTITSKKAQTTRHRILGIRTEPNVQFLFLDTPGYQREHENALNRVLNRAVGQAVTDADVVVFMVEALRFSAADAAVLSAIGPNKKVILAVNKIDRCKDRAELLAFLTEMQARHAFAATVPTSIKQKGTLTELKRAVAKLLPVAPAQYGDDEVTDKSERFMAAEFIREKVFRQLGDELPYSVNVVIEKFEIDGKLRRVLAAIIVDKASQKAILIGAKGERLKRIGTDARKDMELTFGGKVYLELWVRVKKGWADDDAMLRQFGYQQSG